VNKVSIVIPTLNAAAELPALLARISRQTLKPTEVLVIDCASSDETRALAQARGASVVTIRREDFDHGGTRNLALQRACGDVIVFTVQDAQPVGDDWIEQLVAPIGADPRVGAVTGRQIARHDASPLERLTRDLTYGTTARRRAFEDLRTLGLPAAFCSDANAAYPVAALRKVGGFPQPCIVNEDMAAAIRLMKTGYTVVYQPSAAVVHSHAYGFVDQVRRHFDIGVFLATSEEIGKVATPRRDALYYLKAQFLHVIAERRVGLLAAWCVDVIARAIGSLLGIRYHLLPHSLRVRLSRQRAYWTRKVNMTGR